MADTNFNTYYAVLTNAANEVRKSADAIEKSAESLMSSAIGADPKANLSLTSAGNIARYAQTLTSMSNELTAALISDKDTQDSETKVLQQCIKYGPALANQIKLIKAQFAQLMQVPMRKEQSSDMRVINKQLESLTTQLNAIKTTEEKEPLKTQLNTIWSKQKPPR